MRTRGRRRRHGTARSEGGFTLLEITISLTILAFGLLALTLMQLQALRGGTQGRHHTTAAMIARDQLEQIQRAPFSQIAPVAWGAAPGWMAAAGLTVGNTNVQVTSPNGAFVEQAYTVAWRITTVAGNPQLMNVDVEVTWVENEVASTKPTRTGLPTVTLSSIIVDNDR